ncbi:hypothetical protein ASG49_04250 [Marmoricola sp. Leaf446]|uniref:M12 family metallo-peptidase n=1 Tax=Marmoricola sp. Leaf446 TaxID=1736379 RepID=UPI0007008696|nr:M12 family metallo-peptidase [Marmoricola sp. Leaf446]KQT94129.1 hypothetical protein ASG49_04250 [Marmoricola sp. Leaf446]
MTPRARRLIALGATTAVAAAVLAHGADSLSVPDSRTAITAPSVRVAEPADPAVSSAAADGRRDRGAARRARVAEAPAQEPATDRPTGDEPASDQTAGDQTAGDRTGATSTPRAVRGPQASGVTTDRVLPRTLTGREVLASHRDLLPELARRNSRSTAELRDLLSQDETVHLVSAGYVFYAEPQAQEAAVEGTTGQVPLTALFPQAQTFALHSRPGSTRTVYLDFDGATVSGTAWNDAGSDHRLPSGTWKGWDSNGDATTFSLNEHAWVQHVWRQVAESFAAFDVDVTTADPGAAALRRETESDPTYGTRVVFTSDTSANDQACSGCFGLAMDGSFGEVDPAGFRSPAWVFADNPALSPVLTAQGAAHEVGHTLGLSHDATATSTYYRGTDGWGPLMGLSAMRAVNQWSRGEYAGANNPEDDLQVMQEHHLPLLADDHPEERTAATAVSGDGSTTARGVITSRSDVDTFRLDLGCDTTVQAAAKGIGAQTALDLSLELQDADGRRLDLASPASGYRMDTYPLGGLLYPVYVSTGMDATVTRTLTRGTYYLRVDGVGNSSSATSTYSDYASIGSYTLTTHGCGTTVPAPTPTPTPAPASPVVLSRPGAPSIGAASSGSAGGTVSATARWAAPRVTGGQAILGYRVRAYKLDSRNRVVRTYTTGRTAANVRALVYRLPQGRYTFVVTAENGLGASPWSSRSVIVTAR